MSIPKPARALILIATALLLPWTGSAQVLYGSLTGNVTDPSGAAVPRAKIDIVNVNTGISTPALTDERGVIRQSKAIDCEI